MKRQSKAFGLGLWTLLFALSMWPAAARAQVVAAEPLEPIAPAMPEGVEPREVQVVVHVVVSATGDVESAIATSRIPETAPEAFAEAAIRAVRATKFRPSLRAGTPVRSRVEYVVVFVPPAQEPPPAPVRAELQAPARPKAPTQPKPETAPDVQVRGVFWESPRGIGEQRIQRAQLTASPRQQTSEMLSAAPGFFVDHEDGEGLGNDVFLRGFDLDHGSGIEMRLGSVPLNTPTHVQGQGYADVNFIIPEVVQSVHVLQGPYDPRQGDAAIVGSAYFDLGVRERGYQLKTSYGSFNQRRVLGIVAPRGESEETFAAFALRKTDGFGQNRAGQSGSVNTQYGLDLGASDHLRVIATAYGATSDLAGVVREDDVDHGRIGFYDSYPYNAQHQSVTTSRVLLGTELNHTLSNAGKFVVAPWVSWTNFRARQNYEGSLESSQINPALFGLGDLFETTNLETAAGASASYRDAPFSIGSRTELAIEPGVYVRIGQTKQTKSLLDPTNLTAWDRRLDARLTTLDAGAYVDFDWRLWKRIRLSGGPRADLLSASIEDRLANVVPAGSGPPGAQPGIRKDVAGIFVGPRATLEYTVAPELATAVSYGEGYRSLDAAHLRDGSTHPYSRIRSVEVGVRAQDAGHHFVSTLAVFDTYVGNELVFVAAEGGLETESASERRGVVGSMLLTPWRWLLASTSLSVTNAEFRTRIPGVSHYVPNVPPILFRADVSARGTLVRWRKALIGRVGAGYTFMSGRHLSDAILGPDTNALNVGGQLRYDQIEIGFDVYNALGQKYADNADRYISNFSVRPGRQLASVATHLLAAPPTAVLASLSLYF